jgi:hypothetical protein
MSRKVSEQPSDSLQKFARSDSITDRWIAARELMARREITKVLATSEFSAGWQAILSGVETHPTKSHACCTLTCSCASPVS